MLWLSLKRAVTTVYSLTVLVLAKYKGMKIQSLEQRRVCDQDL